MTDFKVAWGPNTGDDFHELRATRQAIRPHRTRTVSKPLPSRGLGFHDEACTPRGTCDGIGCARYFGGRDSTMAIESPQGENQWGESSYKPKSPICSKRTSSYGAQCSSIQERGALILPMAWKERLGNFKRSEVVELQLANHEVLRGEACWPVEIKIDGFRPVSNEVVFVDMGGGGRRRIRAAPGIRHPGAGSGRGRHAWTSTGSSEVHRHEVGTSPHDATTLGDISLNRFIHAPLPPFRVPSARHDGRDQRTAGVQGGHGRARHHRRLPRRVEYASSFVN